MEECEEGRFRSAFNKWATRIKWAAAIIIFAMLGAGLMVSHKPEGLTLNAHVLSGEVSPYLSNELAPIYYNGLQKGEPFKLTVTEEGLNNVIARSKWPQQIDFFTLFTPTVQLTNGSVKISAIVQFKGANLAIVILSQPKLDESGMLNFGISEALLGAMPITNLAKSVSFVYCEGKYGAIDSESELLTDKIILSLLKDQPFEPVFELFNNHIRVTSLIIGEGEITIGLEPL